MSAQEDKSTNQFEALTMDDKIQPTENSIVYFKRNYGRMIPILINPHNGDPKYLLGPHFYVFILAWVFSLGLIVFILKTLYFTAIPILWIISTSFCLLFLYTYVKIGFSLPGVASSPNQPNLLTRSQQRYCIPCRIVRPKGTRHCYYCDVCIQQLDHHCPWVGKCIGKSNLCLFYIFLIVIGLMMSSLLLTAVTANPDQKI